MNMKRKGVKRKKTGTKRKSNKVTKFQIKTFVFDTITKTKDAKEIDEVVNEFLKTVDIKDEDKIMVEQGDGYIRVSIIYRVRINKV